ncbi:DUF6252 family protein [Bizionia myxarmorum]|uniref:Lipocalin-like domain-containing protein n=1 Tax=Bizionia myxarmorum TaxID=291186 RepID=A0A5D0R4K3_9FLAO|nr:DUF6252 family protein [Bizionia myxarmorum]TYB75806.1 hypothetical protein ES674_13345 [Bizionia myxarmorum]
MTTLKLLTVFMMVTAIASLSSCKSDDDGGDPTTSGGAGIISAKIDGIAFSSLEITSMASEITAGPSTTLTFQGNTSNKAISVILSGFDGVGTYQLSDSNIFSSATYSEPNVSDPTNMPTWNAPYQDSGLIGEVKVSENSADRIKGTFTFKAKNVIDDTMKNVTEGTFDLKKQIF